MHYQNPVHTKRIEAETLITTPIIVALDYPDTKQAIELVRLLDPSRCRLKVGKELFTRGGPQLVEQLQKSEFEIFLDLKFHDIPNTVAAACKAAADLGVWMLNVHAMGGRRMLNAAREAIDSCPHRPKLIAVTVLTSMTEDEVHEIGLTGSTGENVSHLAGLAKDCGMDGVVCSAKEASTLKQENGDDFLLVSPGIRPQWAAVGDQTRIMTPRDALAAGSDYLVIGRPITAAENPLQALERVVTELDMS
jgi:orotidine-5'-phosphate decarboxylase